jgi:FlaA1/EpsC-like NDP-sugar epimerase
VVVFVTDLILLPISMWAAFGFRLGVFDPEGPLGLINPFRQVAFIDASIVVFACAVTLYLFKLHRIKLHAIDLDAIFRVAVFSAAILAITSAGAFFLQAGFPRSVAIYFAAIFFISAILVRLLALRLLRGFSSYASDRVPVAIYGAGAAGVQLVASLKASNEAQPVMFVDDNPTMHGLIVAGLRVKPPSILKKAVKERRIAQVLVAIPSLSTSRMSSLIERLSQLDCAVKIVPSYADLVSGRTTVSDLRIATPEELLGRDRVDLNAPAIAKAYSDRCVMVTGAGGSIGSELCRQILECSPRRIILFERSEPDLYEIERAISSHADLKTVIIETCLASVTDEAAVAHAIGRYRVDVILHAAAYKHVPIIEENEVEGARNNVIGTKILADAAFEAGIERFILISTDKAVRPSNVMGATKRMAELVLQDAQSDKGKTKFSMVRFGNVLGSSGSVVPLFSRQIAAGGPVTVTHPEVTRYFMTILEASRLVLLAGAYAEGSDLFVLNMGEPVKIMTLAERMIELSGRTIKNSDNPEGDIAIEIVGMRPGEKLFEELLLDDDSLVQTPHEKILRASSKGLPTRTIATMIERTEAAIASRDASAIRAIASDYVDGYEDSSKFIPLPGKGDHEEAPGLDLVGEGGPNAR